MERAGDCYYVCYYVRFSPLLPPLPQRVVNASSLEFSPCGSAARAMQVYRAFFFFLFKIEAFSIVTGRRPAPPDPLDISGA